MTISITLASSLAFHSARKFGGFPDSGLDEKIHGHSFRAKLRQSGNSLFYKDFEQHAGTDRLMEALHKEIDFTKWFSFGERMMGFNQWAEMNDYERGITHPLDKAHEDAVKLMLPEYKKIIGGKK